MLHDANNKTIHQQDLMLWLNSFYKGNQPMIKVPADL